ncbi:MAG TPA: radical SAM protein [Longilinea sp.]|nr:radical SAM protein [Longilinea sp.]
MSYDLHGRLWTALLRQVSYRRGLNGKVVAKWFANGLQRDRRWLSTAECDALLEDSQQIVRDLVQAISNGEAYLSTMLKPSDIELLNKAAAFMPELAAQDKQHFEEIYKPVGILPPDQYMAVVLQLTEGCAFNTCTFCTFYRDRPFRIKKPDEFQNHLRAIRNYLGEGLSLRRTIFLGDANALIVPMPQLSVLIEQVHQVYDVEQMGGIFAFLDGFSGEKKSQADYRLLAGLGLKRVYIGLESGDPDLLRFLRKPGEPSDAVAAVNSMKNAGISVGLIVLLGAGGHRFEQNHIRETIRVLNQMPLDADDLIYFSELIETEGMPYVQTAYAEHLLPLTPNERLRQGKIIEAGLRFSTAGGTPHISRYDIREFVY